MLWKEIILLLFLVQSVILVKGKGRLHKRDDKPDPLLNEIFKSTPKEAKAVHETRPDRSIDPNEELEALLTGFQNRNKHIFPQENPVKRESGPEPSSNVMLGQDQFMNLNTQGSNVNRRMEIPQSQFNLMDASQMPAMQNALFAADANQQNLMQQQTQQQQLLNGMAAASLMQSNDQDNEYKSAIQGRNIIPGRPAQQRNDWANKPGISIYLHPDKKSTIPIPVKADASNAPNPGSFPLQMRRISPNMNMRSVVPFHAEFGETVESVLKKPEEVLAKKSEIPHTPIAPNTPAKKSEVAQPAEAPKEADKAGKPSDPSKKDFLQQPLVNQMLPQQQAAFQTASQLGASQSSAAFAAPSIEAVTGAPCEDQYNTCAAFAKNDYCSKYPDQMAIQCRKSCEYCVAPVVPTLDSKQQIAVQQQQQPAPITSKPVEVASGSGSGDSSGSGDTDDNNKRTIAVKKINQTHSTYLPELGSGADSGSGSGDASSGGSESDVVRQLASAQNIVSGLGQQATASRQVNNNIKNTTKKTEVPNMKQVMLHIKPAVNEISKKNIIPQSPVSPLTDMDGENVDADDDDTASGSASGSGSGDYTQQVDRVVKSSIAKASKVTKKAPKEIKKASKDTKKAAKVANKASKAANKASKVTKKASKAAKKASKDAKKASKAAAKNSKKSSIATPVSLPKISSAYPRIDLRKIASALANYEEAALTLVGEYPRTSNPDNDVRTRSQIPRPGGLPWSPFNKLRQNIQIARLVTQDSQKRYQIPKYLLVGDEINEKDGVETVRSAVPEGDSLESVAERFKVPGLQPSLQELYAETGKSMYETEGAKRTRIAKKKKKKIQKPVDPFEYLRNMQPGASMEPIIDPHAKSSVRESVSYPVFLMKVMPGSHKYAPAAPRSKVVPNPKRPAPSPKRPAVAKQAKASQKHNVASQRTQYQAPVYPAAFNPASFNPAAFNPAAYNPAAFNPAPLAQNRQPESEFELSPVPVMNTATFAESQPGNEANFQQSIVDVGAPLESSQTAPFVDGSNEMGRSPALQNAAPNPAAAMQEPQHKGVENARQERPSLRTKMLSAFFHNKKSHYDGGSGSGDGEAQGNNMNTRETIWGTGSLIPEQPLMPQSMPQKMNYYGK